MTNEHPHERIGEGKAGDVRHVRMDRRISDVPSNSGQPGIL